MTFIGIDPGAKGALAVVQKGDVAKMLIGVYPFSLESYRTVLADLKKSGEDLLAAVEDVHAMPKQGVTSMFNFGVGFGFIQGVLSAFGIPFELVRPQKWKKEFSISDKNESIAVCQRLFPDMSLLPSERCRVPSDGMAEALLMAEYARRKMGAC